VTTVFLSQFWVQRLSWTLLHFLWQGTVIAVVYAMLRSLLGRSLSAQGRYVLACAALMAMSVAPPLTFLLVPSAGGTGSWTISAAEWQRLLPAVVALWLLGVLAFSIRLLGGWRFTARLRSTAHPAAAEWRQTLERIAAGVGARQPVRLLVSSLVDVPTVIGWLRPVILVPVEFFTGLPFEHVTALLAHELAHIRRHDYLASILQGIAESVLFYHPAVWWISEQIRSERELCCDDLAVAATGDVLAYARALAELESRQPVRLTPALAANGGSLVNRIRRLMEPAHAIANNLPGPGAAWAMMLLWLAGMGVAAVHGTRTPAQPVTNVVPVTMPAPSTFVAIAGTARNTFLYDPLFAAKPAQPRASGNASARTAGDTAEPRWRDSRNEDAAHIAAGSERTTFVPLNNGEEREQKPQQAPEAKLEDHLEVSVSARTADKVLPMHGTTAAQQVPALESPARAPTTPTFRAATKLVQVEVIARRKDAPAAGLIEEDFALFDNGKPQKIASFAVSSSQTSAPASDPLPEGAVSNRLERNGEALANATVLLIDQRNTAQTDQAFAIQRIVKFLRTRRNRDTKPDRIGIYTFDRDNSIQVLQEITDDAELLRQAADKLKPRDSSYRFYDTHYGTPGMTAHQPEDRELDTKHMLEAIARHLASVPGRKGLIWITAGFPVSAPTFDFNPDMEEAASALNDADVALYAVDARGLIGALSGTTSISNAEFGGAVFGGAGSANFRPLPQLAKQMQPAGGFPDGTGAMSKLAGLTGGLALYNSNGIEDSIRKALDDAALTYTLSFYPSQEQQDGAWHKLRVKVARPGVSVRYREKYFASRTLAEASDRPTLAELLRGPLDATQLKLVTEMLPDQARQGSLQVRTFIDLHDVHLENRNNIWVGAVDVSFLLEGSRSAQTVTRTVQIPDGRLAAALKQGIVVDDSFGETGELRIVAQDRATGAAGSVRIPLRSR
jgi:VWFA-related protein